MKQLPCIKQYVPGLVLVNYNNIIIFTSKLESQPLISFLFLNFVAELLWYLFVLSLFAQTNESTIVLTQWGYTASVTEYNGFFH